jgi:hypothetical protein
MERDELIAHMRERIAMCRRLAASTTDDRTAAVLRQMADEGEADVLRLLGEGKGDDKIDIILKPNEP